jgi:predicted small metal-binding protein
MDAPREVTNRCACGWEINGPEEAVVDATIDHGRRLHNMEATREQVLAALHAEDARGAARGPREGAADNGAGSP